jgi:hypothetical protein
MAGNRGRPSDLGSPEPTERRKHGGNMERMIDSRVGAPGHWSQAWFEMPMGQVGQAITGCEAGDQRRAPAGVASRSGPS